MACFLSVEKGCGKTCGDCGKVFVFNSYSVFFQSAQHHLTLHACMYNHLLFLPDINYVAAGNRYLFPKHAVKS